MESNNATLAREYLAWLRDLKGRRPSTTYNYAATIDQLLEFAGSRRLIDLQLDDLEAFLLRPRIKTRGPRAMPGTLAREATTLRSLYSYLHQRGYVKRDPAAFLASPRRPKRDPRPITDDQWCELWARPLPLDARVVLGLGFFCGLRRMEIVGLHPQQVERKTRQLVAFERKGGGEHSLPYGVMLDVLNAELPELGASEFVAPLYELCDDARACRRPLLVPWAEEIAALASKRPRRVHPLPAGKIDPQIVYKRLNTWLAAAGVPRAFTPHQLRYSCATNLARAGMPVQLIQRVLNHASLGTTERYVRSSNADIAEWAGLHLRREGGGRH